MKWVKASCTTQELKSSSSHFANLLSHRSVKEGFDRKPTTIERSCSAVRQGKLFRIEGVRFDEV